MLQHEPVLVKWLEMLRSGKYAQGRAYLQRDGKYCCLGVLCEAWNQVYPEQKLETTEQYVVNGRLTVKAYNETTGILPTVLTDKLNLTYDVSFTEPVSVEGKCKSSGLIQANDRLGYSFLVIADLVEQNYDKLRRPSESRTVNVG